MLKPTKSVLLNLYKQIVKRKPRDAARPRGGHTANPKSKNIVIVGSGRLVGIPIIRWLKGQKITPIVLNKYSKNIASFTRQADILISGVGKANLITPTMIKNGAVCIDFGFSKKNKKISGDFSQDVAKKAGVFTPTPGGTGPLTVAELIVNLLTLLRVFPCHIE